MTVFAADVPDVVSSIGGLLFDRRSAGWDVTVLLDGMGDVRPLTILGLDVIAPPDDWASSSGASSPAGLAIAGDRLMTDDALRGVVLHAAESGVTEVAMWGEGPPADVGSPIDSVVYRMSRAAEAFKCEALRVAGSPGEQACQYESFYRFGRRPVVSDLEIIR